ncbi:MAG: hypothetical protein ACHQIG_09620 [Acidimicrobiia bacterium]
MTSSGPCDDVTLDDVVARVRELPTRLRSLYVETERRTDDAWMQVASNLAHGTLVHGPDPSTQLTRRSSMESRTWMELGHAAWSHKFRVMGVQPARWRNEARFHWADGRVEEIVIGCDGDVGWERDAEGAEFWTSHGGSLRDWWVLNLLWVDAPVERELLDATSEVLGRTCAQVHIRSRPGRFRMWAPGPYIGGEHVLSIDLAMGMTLAIRSFNEGVEFETHDVVALEIDPAIDPSLTRVPAGSRPRAERPTYADESALAEVVDAFTLMAPARLPDGYAFHLAYPDPAPDGKARATIVYTLDRRRPLHVHEHEAAPGRLPDVEGWTRIERGDRTALISDATAAEGTRLAATSVRGTHVFLSGELSADEMLDVAFSLEPVRP